ncbi:MAG: 4-hydroxythreonine-4-phosphate dehydrogenase PdxA [Chromatiales bacterium]
MTPLPRLAITAGEPAGIGPDICLQLAVEEIDCAWAVYADPELLQQRTATLGLDVLTNIISADNTAQPHQPGQINVVPVPLKETVTAGRLNAANSDYVLQSLRMACNDCQNGFFDALVTAPLHKGIINDAGIPFTGHTEFLAELTQADPVMMLACPGLRVALVTTHMPLKDVSSAVTAETVGRVIRILHQDLQNRFGITQPRIFVCGLNPHAGESGHLGREELEVISPTLEQLRQDGITLYGPLSADTLFTPKYLEQADVVLAMYHDQGLPVLKHMGFGQAVNVTLGLPIIRTSVDHGTALELAGTGKADVSSLRMAMQTAIEMSRHSVTG